MSYELIEDSSLKRNAKLALNFQITQKPIKWGAISNIVKTNLDNNKKGINC